MPLPATWRLYGLPLTILALALGWTLVVLWPQRAALARWQARWEQAEQARQAMEGAMAQLRALSAEAQAAAETTERWQASILRESECPTFYAHLVQLASQCGIRLSRLSPQAPVDCGGLYRIPIQMLCSGQFSKIAAFLAHLENLAQIVWITDFRWGPSQGESGETELQAVLNVFVEYSEGSGQNGGEA